MRVTKFAALLWPESVLCACRSCFEIFSGFFGRFCFLFGKAYFAFLINRLSHRRRQSQKQCQNRQSLVGGGRGKKQEKIEGERDREWERERAISEPSKCNTWMHSRMAISMNHLPSSSSSSSSSSSFSFPFSVSLEVSDLCGRWMQIHRSV